MKTNRHNRKSILIYTVHSRSRLHSFLSKHNNKNIVIYLVITVLIHIVYVYNVALVKFYIITNRVCDTFLFIFIKNHKKFNII